MRRPLTATACAHGWVEATVNTLPLTKTTSAAPVSARASPMPPAAMAATAADPDVMNPRREMFDAVCVLDANAWAGPQIVHITSPYDCGVSSLVGCAYCGSLSDNGFGLKRVWIKPTIPG